MISGMHSSRGTVICALAIALAGAPSATAAPGTAAMSGQITITGTDGKDELNIDVGESQTGASSVRMRIEPAATVTGASGACPPETDQVTGRPTHNDCVITPSSGLALTIDLRAGDDRVTSEDPEGLFPAARVNGGLGNDTIILEGNFTARTLNGDDGNDVLAAPGRQSASTGGNRPTAYNGGAGTDMVDLSGLSAEGPNGSGRELGVNASLVSNTAVYAALNSLGQQTTFRTDTMSAIETLSGSRAGDVLTGSAAADTLIGSDGNDNLVGGDGNDNLQGGNGLDNLDGGRGTDSIDGGSGIDSFPRGPDADTIISRDGYLESVTCISGSTIINDLVDTVTGDPRLCSVSTAAAKHLFDTHLSGKPAKIGSSGALVTKVSCPELKTEACAGEVEALLGKTVLGRTDYRVAQGRTERVRLPLKVSADRAAGRKIVLSATEVDPDGRDRFVSRPTRVEKTRPD
jgi:Ca2+-binding RTX toxin-like protein